jgi:hypothetical protein
MSRVIRQLDFSEAVQKLQQARQPYHANYLAMYSSWLGGVTTEPGLMLVPVDDHLLIGTGFSKRSSAFKATFTASIAIWTGWNAPLKRSFWRCPWAAPI